MPPLEGKLRKEEGTWANPEKRVTEAGLALSKGDASRRLGVSRRDITKVERRPLGAAFKFIRKLGNFSI